MRQGNGELARRIAPLFAGWDETMIWSYLDGCMGTALVDDDQNPTAAQIILGDFCFFAGRPDAAIAARAGAPIAVPQNGAWAAMLERVWGGRAHPAERYAILKEPDAFDRAYLTRLACAPEGVELRLFDEDICRASHGAAWSRDFCVNFRSDADFLTRGLGVAALRDGEPVAGAASYTVYDGGIEIEIDTRPDCRRQGLATACGARLILECLARGLYPSWDAHDLRSAALAEKLGYRRGAPYRVYELALGEAAE